MHYSALQRSIAFIFYRVVYAKNLNRAFLR